MVESTEPRVGAVLRDLRVQRGLSQEQLAAKAKMHRNYIGGVERGEKSPTFKSVARISAVLGVNGMRLYTLMRLAEGKRLANCTSSPL